MLRRLALGAALGAALAALLGAAAPAAAKCLRYEPHKVALTGEVVARRMPGPPGYRNVARGDYPETVHFLELDEPFCVVGDRGSRTNEKTHFDVSEVQLTGDAKPGRHVGDAVRVRGTLFGAHMPYHRTDVVMNAESLRVTP